MLHHAVGFVAKFAGPGGEPCGCAKVLCPPDRPSSHPTCHTSESARAFARAFLLVSTTFWPPPASCKDGIRRHNRTDIRSDTADNSRNRSKWTCRSCMSHRSTILPVRDGCKRRWCNIRSAPCWQMQPLMIATPSYPRFGRDCSVGLPLFEYRWEEKEWVRRDSNPEPSHYEWPALTVELQTRGKPQFIGRASTEGQPSRPGNRYLMPSSSTSKMSVELGGMAPG